ncbi:MAG: TPR repeat protein [Oleiphilaceae bacterium]|jgi:TPR repeat protein
MPDSPSFSDLDKGRNAYKKGNYKIAFGEFKVLAEQGHTGSQFSLGNMYAKGQGTIQDYKEAIHWFTKSAEQGDAGAQYYLGYIYGNDPKMTHDYNAAFHWYTKAAEKGHSVAQLNLGVMYIKGQGTIQDHVRAHMWWNIAASLGNDASAQRYRDQVEDDMTPSQLEQALTLGRECVAKVYKNTG